MDQNSLKTSMKQRIIIILIAVLLLGSTIAAYVAIVVSSGSTSSVSKLEEEYTAVQTEISSYSATLSDLYFSSFSGYRSQVKAYNAEAANNVGVQKTDLKEGDGRELTAGDLNYFAYYIGWCPDETIFESSFDDSSDPTALKVPLYAGQGLIEGWNEGVVGMKIGGVREIQMPGELAYGESREVCGTTNSPLKFIIMPIADAQLSELETKLETAYNNLVQAYYSSSASSTTSPSATSSSSSAYDDDEEDNEEDDDDDDDFYDEDE